MVKHTEDKKLTNEIVDDNIKAIHGSRRIANESRRSDEKFIDNVAAFIGSTNSLYIHTIFYLSYFIYLNDIGRVSSVASIEAIFLALFVLINQKRMNKVERRHSDLHLQTTLLLEHELTSLARVVHALAEKMKVEDSQLDELLKVKEDIVPDDILNRIKHHETTDPTSK